MHRRGELRGMGVVNNGVIAGTLLSLFVVLIGVDHFGQQAAGISLLRGMEKGCVGLCVGQQRAQPNSFPFPPRLRCLPLAAPTDHYPTKKVNEWEECAHSDAIVRVSERRKMPFCCW